MVPCARCGQDSPEGSLHCVHCGTRVGDDGLARTQMGMPVIKAPAGSARPVGLLAGLPALRTKTTSPLVSGEFSLHPAEGNEALKTMVGMPIYEGALRAEVPAEPAPLETPEEEPAATVAMMGLTDEQVGEEPAATLAMMGLTDAQVGEEPAATVAMVGLTDDQVEAAAPAVSVVATPAARPATPAKAPASSGGGNKWIVILVALAAAGAAAWFVLRP